MEFNQTVSPSSSSKSSSFSSRLDIVPGLTFDKVCMEPSRIIKCAKIFPSALEQMPEKQLEQGEIIFKSRKRYLDPETVFNVQQKKRIRTNSLRNIPPEKSVKRSLRSSSDPLMTTLSMTPSIMSMTPSIMSMTPSIMSLNTSSNNSNDISSKCEFSQTKSKNNTTQV